MKGLHMVTFILLVIGGLNWGLTLLGMGVENFLPDMLTKAIYALVAISALVEIFTHKKNCRACGTSNPVMPM